VESTDSKLSSVDTLDRRSELSDFSKSTSCMSVSAVVAITIMCTAGSASMKGVIPKLVMWSDLRGAEKEGSDVLGIRLYVVVNKMTLKNPRWSMLNCKLRQHTGREVLTVEVEKKIGGNGQPEWNRVPRKVDKACYRDGNDPNRVY
jgi:hypothetical protein